MSLGTRQGQSSGYRRERAREAKKVKVTVTSKEKARCCGFEIRHGDFGGLDTGVRGLVGLHDFSLQRKEKVKAPWAAAIRLVRN